MNQAISFQGAIAGCSTRQDKSLTVRVETPELTSEQKMMVIELQDVPCEIAFKPLEGFSAPHEIKTELHKRTQSERIRNVLFAWWKEVGEPGRFDDFYNSETEKIITSIKLKLPQSTIT